MSICRAMTVDRASFSDLAALRRFVTDACLAVRADADMRDSLELAADEACTNIVEHGYSDGRAGPLTLAVEGDDLELRVSIADRGTPFHPDRAPIPNTTAELNQRVPGGLGWHLIRSVVDAIHYDAGADGTNRLTLTKRRRAEL